MKHLAASNMRPHVAYYRCKYLRTSKCSIKLTLHHTCDGEKEILEQGEHYCSLEDRKTYSDVLDITKEVTEEVKRLAVENGTKAAHQLAEEVLDIFAVEVQALLLNGFVSFSYLFSSLIVFSQLFFLSIHILSDLRLYTFA